MTSILLIFLFAAMMVATILISALPGATIRLLETTRFYKKGKLYNEKRNYVSGDGHHVYRRVYLYIDKNGSEKFANLEVFIRLLFISVMVSAMVFVVYLIAGSQ